MTNVQEKDVILVTVPQEESQSRLVHEHCGTAHTQVHSSSNLSGIISKKSLK